MKRWLASIAAVAIVSLACSPDPLPGHVAAAAEERASVLATIDEYYRLLNSAIAGGEIGPLYVRHPKLAEGSIPERGINSEAVSMLLPSVRNHLVREAHVDLEFYEPVRVYVKGNAAVAYMHGLLTWNYAAGETKGELRVRFDLSRTVDRWSIEQTDEVMQGETPPPTQR